MRVKCIKEFYDLERKTTAKVADEFEVSEARGEALTTANNKAGYPLCEVVVSPESASEPKKSRKKKEV